MRTEQQKQAIAEVKALRRAIRVRDSPYSLEATAGGPMPWWHKIGHSYAEAQWPCSPWWKEYIRCVVRTRTCTCNVCRYNADTSSISLYDHMG